VIGDNYWIFGEKYALVSADETFETALKNHLYVLDGKNGQTEVEYEYIRDRPDIFITRQQIKDERIHNIIVELKHPQKRLGETEVSQIKKYMRLVKNDPRFNDPTSYWDFILVGTKFDTSGFIESELESAKSHGETGIIQKVNNHSIFVKTWSQVQTDSRSTGCRSNRRYNHHMSIFLRLFHCNISH
jgi:transcriptional regulator NrdR family protein